MIDVIIPVYKAHDTIQNTLHSISMQRLVDFKIYLVVDGEPQPNYDYLREFFDVNILYMPKNAGPGVARQFGIDNSSNDFISFIDADDTYLSSLALYYQHLPFNDKVAMVSCNFLEEKKDHDMHLRENDMVWMHGKMYRRAFLDKYNIRFNDTRANEDVGFNTMCQCYANEDEQVYLSKDVTYMWQHREGSIVRANNAAYAFNESIEGYVLNKTYAFKSVIDYKGIDDSTKFFIMKGLAHLFGKYMAAMIRAPKRLKFVKRWAKKYYDEVYKLVDDEYIKKAEPTVLVTCGFKKQDEQDEYYKWKDSLDDAR